MKKVLGIKIKIQKKKVFKLTLTKIAFTVERYTQYKVGAKGLLKKRSVSR
jgi:hypothetical protein